MEIILLERVSRLGQMGDTVKVKDGFARNFLLPQGKALRANEANKKKFEGQRAELEARNLKRKSEATQVAEKLDGESFIAVRSAGETGQLYGSVSTRDIADLLTAEGFSINRNQILLNQPIKTIGVTNVAIALHPEVEVTVSLNIARTADEAERQAKGETLTTAEAIYGDDINDNARPESFFDPDVEFGYAEVVADLAMQKSRSSYRTQPAAPDEREFPVGKSLEAKRSSRPADLRNEELANQQSTPASIVKRLRSSTVSDRVDGIREATKFLLSLEERVSMETGKAHGLAEVDWFETSTIPERLYEKLFATDPDEARAAAYALVVSAPGYRGALDPGISPDRLNSSEADDFRSRLLQLLSDIGLRYVSYVDAEDTAPAGLGKRKFRVLVKVSRKLPFNIDGRDLLLKDAENEPQGSLYISSPLAEDPGGPTKIVPSTDRSDPGTIVEGEADIIIAHDRLRNKTDIPVTVFFNHAVETIDVPIVR